MTTYESGSYFTSYEDLEIHELMLRDRPRQKAYYDAIVKNVALFKDKVVLDVGAGTGILSAFAAHAGAKLVYAVEASDLAVTALKIIEDNNLTNIVKVIHSKIEDFELPSAVEKVDIVISEWMGFYLLHEGMLDSVLFARDKFLKPDGLLFPNEATLYIAPCEVPSRYSDWEDVDGVNMRRFAEKLREQKFTKPEIAYVKPEHLLHEGVAFYWINLMEVTLQEIREINHKEVMPTQVMGRHEGFCIWFEVHFPAMDYENRVVLSTAPSAPQTHWKQCVIVLPENICYEVEVGEPVAFRLKMVRNEENQRRYHLEIELLDPTIEQHQIPCDCFLTKCLIIKEHLQRINTDPSLAISNPDRSPTMTEIAVSSKASKVAANSEVANTTSDGGVATKEATAQ